MGLLVVVAEEMTQIEGHRHLGFSMTFFDT